MSEVHTVMKFEFLPNEILIECFEYLNAPDIFHSFDKLNYRFHELIRNIRLHLNIRHGQKSMFDQFCANMLLNPEIKNQILSLQLSHTIMCDTIQLFLSQFSLAEFSHLQSLKLIGTDEGNIWELESMLPLLPNLRCFYFTGGSFGSNMILKAALGMSKIQTLSLPRLSTDLFATPQFSSIARLTISHCSAKRLCYFFEYVPTLQYLKVRVMVTNDGAEIEKEYPTNESALHLKQLIVNDFAAELNDLEKLLKQTPNLKSLTISVEDNREIVDARRWKNLIKSSLPHLDIFKFKFSVTYSNENDDILAKFQEFQTDFWHTKHHWHTEWEFSKDQASIYTTPYVLYNYTLNPNSKRYCTTSVVNFNTFDKVTDLTLYLQEITENCQYYFSNMRSLTLKNDIGNENEGYPFLKTKHIRCLKMIVNFDNLIDLDISSNIRLKSPSVLLQILKEAPQLSSIKIEMNLLISLFNNRELCRYFNKMIKRLDVLLPRVWWTSINNDVMMKICDIFSNIEQFRCDANRSDDLSVILNVLSKLSSLILFSFRLHYTWRTHYWLRNHKAELNAYPFTVVCENYNYADDHDDDDYYDLFYDGYGYDSDDV